MRGSGRLILMAALVAVAAACAAPLPTRLYTLSPAEAEGSVLAEGDGPLLGLGPVTLPAYLDRPEIVTRAGSHQIRLGEYDRWAEPLQPMVAKLLRERLQQATGSREVVPLPSERGAEPRHAVAVEVDRFDADEAGRVVLEARWRIYQPANGRTVATGQELVVQEAAPAPDYPALVAAMGQAVGLLAQRIAPAVPGSRAAGAG